MDHRRPRPSRDNAPSPERRTKSPPGPPMIHVRPDGFHRIDTTASSPMAIGPAISHWRAGFSAYPTHAGGGEKGMVCRFRDALAGVAGECDYVESRRGESNR
jgi:hypothetical protein